MLLTEMSSPVIKTDKKTQIMNELVNKTQCSYTSSWAAANIT